MAARYKEYLAMNVLNEGQIVSYRALSRALKVHVNAAKEMLYDFHRQQSARKPGSVHATYLITGLRQVQNSEDISPPVGSDGNNSVMQSSSFRSSTMPNHDSQTDDLPMVKTILVAKEEDLHAAKILFECITSIHIYTLEPNPINDMQILTNCNREIFSKCTNEDPLEAWKQYGTIQNPNVKRRTKRGPPPAPAQIATTAVAKTESRPSSAMVTDHNGAVAKQTETEPRPAKPNRSASNNAQLQAEETSAPGKKAMAKPPTLKRDASSFFKSATKGNGNMKRENTGSSAASSIPSRRQSVEQSPAEDEPMKDASEEEGEDEVVIPSMTKDGSLPSDTRKQREEVLRKMMDDDGTATLYRFQDKNDRTADQDMEGSPAATDDPQDLDPPAPAQPEKEATPEETVTVTGGGRHGRRRVMKKKTMKDEEGYLVTKEEPVWESFSEDEPQPKKAKMPNAAAGTNKAKKAGSKPGHGNIMSFFGKK